MRIELPASPLWHLPADILIVTCTPVYTVWTHCIKRIRYCCYPCFLGYVIPLKPQWISFAVISFMMASCHVLSHSDGSPVLKDVGSHGCVWFYDSVLNLRQFPRTVEYGIGNAYLAYVMEQSCKFQIIDPVLIPAELLRYQHRILTDPCGMTYCVRILGIDRIGQGLDRLERHLFDSPGSFLRNRRLLRNLLCQLLRMIYFKQSETVVLYHRHSGEQRKTGKQDRKPLHESLIIISAERCPERWIEYNNKKYNIISRQQDAVFHVDKITHSYGKKQCP